MNGQLQQNVPLSQYSAMRLGGLAAYLIEVSDINGLTQAVDLARSNNLPVIMIGTGANIFWRDEGFPGLIIVNNIGGFTVDSQDDHNAYLTIGAGEIWDTVVARSVEMGLSGIECLSLIPGTAGATPVQNVGAYGQDISQTLMTVTAYDLTISRLVTLTGSDCQLTYRESIFNTTGKGRYLITAITLLLSKTNPRPPFYAALSSYLEKRNITTYTPQILRDAVIDIRSHRLPDPKTSPNNGSFFANPVVDKATFAAIEENYRDVVGVIPHWVLDSGKVKLSAAWLIDQAGFANYYDQESGIATWPDQPLIFVNRSASTSAGLLAFAERVKTAVRDKFEIELKQEPLLLP
jgi:UDP-N-acetylmuramate dehydrogenase